MAIMAGTTSPYSASSASGWVPTTLRMVHMAWRCRAQGHRGSVRWGEVVGGYLALQGWEWQRAECLLCVEQAMRAH